MSTYIVTIRTKYQTVPGSNVGRYVATAMGRRRTRRTDQSVSAETNHRTVAEHLLFALLDAKPTDATIAETWSSDDGQSRVWTVTR